jgi:hypothetical protein
MPHELDVQSERVESHGEREVAAVSSIAEGRSDSTGVPLKPMSDCSGCNTSSNAHLDPPYAPYDPVVDI